MNSVKSTKKEIFYPARIIIFLLKLVLVDVGTN